jgi:hypothetical protein
VQVADATARSQAEVREPGPPRRSEPVGADCGDWRGSLRSRSRLPTRGAARRRARRRLHPAHGALASRTPGRRVGRRAGARPVQHGCAVQVTRQTEARTMTDFKHGTGAWVWGNEPPAFSIAYEKPMWEGDSGFTVLFDDAPDPEDVPERPASGNQDRVPSLSDRRPPRDRPRARHRTRVRSGGPRRERRVGRGRPQPARSRLTTARLVLGSENRQSQPRLRPAGEDVVPATVAWRGRPRDPSPWICLPQPR